MEIRCMEESDYEDIKKIYNDGIKLGYATFRLNSLHYEDFDKGHLKSCRFVIEENKSIVGWCALSPYSSSPAYNGVAELSIYIDKNNKGKGLGKLLLNHLIDESEKIGIWTLQSSIISTNQRSLKLHKSCGFRVVGTREKIAKDRFGSWNDVILMERRADIF